MPLEAKRGGGKIQDAKYPRHIVCKGGSIIDIQILPSGQKYCE